jgi:hypothetical protein
MSDALVTREFDLSRHNGMVTVRNPVTGGHRTFRIATQPDDADFAPGERIVSLLTGPDRDNPLHWTGFAFVRDEGMARVWSRLRGAGDRPSEWESFARMLTYPESYARRHGLEYMVQAACLRCNRPLTRPDSIVSGYGPECRGKVVG